MKLETRRNTYGCAYLMLYAGILELLCIYSHDINQTSPDKLISISAFMQLLVQLHCYYFTWSQVRKIQQHTSVPLKVCTYLCTLYTSTYRLDEVKHCLYELYKVKFSITQHNQSPEFKIHFPMRMLVCLCVIWLAKRYFFPIFANS